MTKKINGGTFLVMWIAAVTVAMALFVFAAFTTIWTVGEIVERAFGETATAVVVGGLFGALIAGGTAAGQAIVLYQYGIAPLRWIVRTLIAGAVGMSIGMTLVFTFADMDNMPEAISGALIGLSVGLPIGLAQAQLLRQHVAQAHLWILISTAAFIIGFAVGLPLGGENSAWLSVGVVALLVAVLSGAGMLWLVRGQETAVAV